MDIPQPPQGLYNNISILIPHIYVHKLEILPVSDRLTLIRNGFPIVLY